MIDIKRLFNARSAALGLGACVTLGVSACALSTTPESVNDEGDPAETVGEAQQSDHTTKVATQDGFKITWTYVSTPSLARKIAACPDNTIFVQNNDYKVYYSSTGGMGGTWNYSGWPSLAREMACESLSWLVVLNADKSVWRTTPGANGLITGWYWSGTASQADHIASGAGQVYALNTNKAIYSNDWEGEDGHWTYRQTAIDADRVTGADTGYYGQGRSFALNTNKSLWYNNGLTASPSQAWHPLNNGGLTLLEISAGSGNVLFGLTTTYELWKATITEDSCTDGIDNDNNGGTDGTDVACIAKLAPGFCATHANGYYCNSRLVSPQASMGMFSCTDGQYGSYTGLDCTCYLGTPDTEVCPPP